MRTRPDNRNLRSIWSIASAQIRSCRRGICELGISSQAEPERYSVSNSFTIRMW